MLIKTGVKLVQKFCPKCGAQDKKFFKGFCIDCYLRDHNLLRIKDRLKITVCPSCLRFRLRGIWLPSTIENTKKFIKESVKIKKIKEVEKEVVPVKPLEDGALFKLIVRGTLGGEPIEIEKKVELVYEKKQCTVCARKDSRYYKALIQLRPKDPQTKPKRIKRIFRFVRNKNRENALFDREAEIFRFRQLKTGINVYLGSLKSASKIISQLKSTFDAEVKLSRTLVGVDKNGHNDYRSTYSVRI